MKKDNQEIIENNLLLVGKLFDLKYLYVLLAFILSLDIYLIFDLRNQSYQSILSVLLITKILSI